MFKVGDRVRNRYDLGSKGFTGTVDAVNGAWIKVKHDPRTEGKYPETVGLSFDYQEDELQHIDLLERLAHETS